MVAAADGRNRFLKKKLDKSAVMVKGSARVNAPLLLHGKPAGSIIHYQQTTVSQHERRIDSYA
jgi:hypothetical protein